MCGLLVLLLAAGSAGFAQAEDTTAVREADSARVIVLDPGLSLGKPTLLLPPSLREEGEFVVPPFIGGMSYGAPGLPFLLPGTPPAMDMMVSYRLQRAREDELSTLRSVLGTVQIGAVGYVAYMHLKKRGLFK
jgi:hypothetical protein